MTTCCIVTDIYIVVANIATGCLPSRHQPALVEVLQAAKPGTGVAWPSVAPLCAWRTEVKCHARVLMLATILVCRLAREQSFSCKGGRSDECGCQHEYFGMALDV